MAEVQTEQDVVARLPVERSLEGVLSTAYVTFVLEVQVIPAKVDAKRTPSAFREGLLDLYAVELAPLVTAAFAGEKIAAFDVAAEEGRLVAERAVNLLPIRLAGEVFRGSRSRQIAW